MQSQVKVTATIIWFAILSGLFIILHIAGGGLGTLSAEMNLRSIPLFIVGFIPLFVGVGGRMLVIPKAQNDQAFTTMLVICLALCEFPAMLGMFVYHPDLEIEKSFAFVGSVLGVIVLFPLNIAYPAKNIEL